MALTGYPVEDLALRRSFVDASRAGRSTRWPRGWPTEGSASCSWSSATSTGRRTPSPVLGTPKGAPQNAAAVLHRGRVAARYAKHHLPNYGVFDEYRYFVPGSSLTVARVHGVDVAIAICEDIWQEGGPVAGAREAGAGLLLVINGSPYERNKDDVRLDLAVRRAAGGRLRPGLRQHGRRPGRAGLRRRLARGRRPTARCSPGPRSSRPSCSSSTWTCPTRSSEERRLTSSGWCCRPTRCRPGSPMAGAGRRAARGRGRGLRRPGHSACATTSRKNGFRTRGARPVRRHRLGADRRHRLRRDRRGERARRLDARASTPPSTPRSDAAELAERTGLVFQTVPIAPMVATLPVVALADRPGRGEPAGPGPRHHPDGPVQRARPPGAGAGQQERARRRLLDALRRLGRRVRADQGPAEDAGCGGWPAGATRTPRRVARSRRSPRRRSARSRRRSCGRDSSTPTRCPPTTCSTTSWTTTSSRTAASGELLAAGFDQDLVEQVLRLTDRAEYKRRQYPPGPKISFKAFGRDRRLPITNRWQEHAPRP